MTAGDDVGDSKVVDIIDDIIDDMRRACRNSYYITLSCLSQVPEMQKNCRTEGWLLSRPLRFGGRDSGSQ